MSQTDMRRDLETVADYNGAPFARLEEYWAAESQHVHMVRDQSSGTLLLLRAYQSFFLETVQLFNELSPTEATEIELTFYSRFLPKLVHVFQQLCAAELLATHGYPLPAYTQLRNTYDNLVLISAAMQGVTDFFKVEGSDPDRQLDARESKRLRKQAEFHVQETMTGNKSGLTTEAIDNLKIWDSLFDLEVHGAKLSLGSAIGWIKGDDLLHVYPKYQANYYACYSNRVSEIGWMAHRLLPLLQHSGMQFPESWREKWRVLDRRFEETVLHFAAQQEVKVGLAIVELVKAKFPFTEQSLYPLEGTTYAISMSEKNSKGA